MDRFAANTLRTLGIVLISIFVIGVSGFVLLLALCLGALGKNVGQSDQQTFILLILGGVVVIAGGIVAIAKLAKGIVRGTPEYQYPSGVLSISPTQPASESGPAAPAPSATDLSATGTPAESAAELPARQTTPTSSVPTYQPPPQPEARTIVDVTHLRPASRDAIRNLALAISGKLAAEVLLTVSGSLWSYRASNVPFTSFRYTFIAWGIAAIAPMIVLLYALLRHPGPRAFAYSLVIPGLHLFFGLFGHSATIFMLFRLTSGIGPLFPLLSFLPWLLDILVLHLAWKAIRLTGIQPNSTRLIVASAVIFVYTSLLPVIFVFINNIWHLR